MAKSFIISGAGGQGVISAGIFLANVLMGADFFVTFSSCYGAEMRGGAVNCQVNMDDKELYSLTNSQVDYVIALNQMSFDMFVSKVKENGTVIVNSSMAQIKKTRDDIKYIFAPLTQEAQKIGNIKFANSMALGILIKLLGNFSTDSIEKAFHKLLKGKEEFVQKNIEAFMVGFKYELEA